MKRAAAVPTNTTGNNIASKKQIKHTTQTREHNRVNKPMLSITDYIPFFSTDQW